MTCYKPLIRCVERGKYVTAKDGHKYEKASIMSYEDLEVFDKNTQYYKYQFIPCGNCIGCRLDYSREWANRGYLESLEYEQNYFVTITYDDDHITKKDEVITEEGITYTEIDELEWNGTLVPKELTQFIKNVRQIMKRKYNQDGIRFMAAGEYGEENRRPHYHIIFFNLNLPVETFYNPRVSWNNDVYYQNTIIEQAWGKGISNICEANWNNIAYTARYITKKINGKESEDFYAAQGEEKEFFRVSRMPGIGEGYYRKHKEEIYKNDEIIIRNKKGVHTVKPPKYFDMLYERENPDEFKKIKKRREKLQKQATELKDIQTSNTRWERFQIEKRTKENDSSTLKRNRIDEQICWKEN